MHIQCFKIIALTIDVVKRFKYISGNVFIVVLTFDGPHP
jgi:hypothetical protein